GGMGLPALDYYLGSTDRFKQTREQYVQHIQKMLELAGEAQGAAAAQARTVMDIETAFAKASMDNVSRRDPHKIYNKRTLAEIKAAAPDFDWDDYLRRLKAPAVPFYIVSTPGFLGALEAQIKTRSEEDWR